jgi:hypothetical protein
MHIFTAYFLNLCNSPISSSVFHVASFKVFPAEILYIIFASSFSHYNLTHRKIPHLTVILNVVVYGVCIPVLYPEIMDSKNQP